MGPACHRAAGLLFVLLAASPARGDVPDASLQAVKDRTVRLELDGADAVEGQVIGFEETTVTVAVSGSREVVTVARAQLARLILVEPPPGARRIVGLQVSPLGTLAIDADYKRIYGFASTSLMMPILTASGDGTWSASAFAAGVSLPVRKKSRWRLDVFGGVMPLRTTSHYTYVGFGLGTGVHYNAGSGFTLGIKFPVVGFATRIGSSPTGYDAPFRYNDSLGYYYLAAAAGMPLFTMGYRFSTKWPW
jgi:hypothetical protein